MSHPTKEGALLAWGLAFNGCGGGDICRILGPRAIGLSGRRGFGSIAQDLGWSRVGGPGERGLMARRWGDLRWDSVSKSLTGSQCGCPAGCEAVRDRDPGSPVAHRDAGCGSAGGAVRGVERPPPSGSRCAGRRPGAGLLGSNLKDPGRDLRSAPALPGLLIPPLLIY